MHISARIILIVTKYDIDCQYLYFRRGRGNACLTKEGISSIIERNS
ncbi:hypothetical protein HMPREF1985_01252 [Mitsuokella sp. oral taxon 131 str. W9106]|nr:hypothetical protein HMPREF1985_01252 [Mitsuokella sp. oral taxon 131 str. W9106]